MSGFNPFRYRFPYTNINDINLDWIIKRVKALSEAVSHIDISRIDEIAQQAETAQQDAETALTTAQSAETTANSVQGIANNALTTAQSAETTAQSAQTAVTALNDSKADKVRGATLGNFASLAASGNLLDSGHNSSDYAPAAAAVPPGGAAGQVLTKTGAADYAVSWQPQTGGGGDVSADMIGIVITGARPAVAVTAGQYVIVKNSTITGIVDGLYTAVNALSPSTDVTAADLSAVSDGGLNDLQDAFNSRFIPGTLSDLNELGTSARPLLFATYDAQTLNTPYKEGITSFTAGTVFHISSSSNYSCQMVLCAGDTSIYMRRKNINGWGSWTKITPV